MKASRPTIVKGTTMSTPTRVNVPATPVTSAYDVTDIPTITLPLTKATKAHVAAGVAAVAGAAQVATEMLPDGTVKAYVQAGVAVLTIAAVWLGVYTVPNVPKITRK
jgi:hypothetical protein